MNLLGLKAYVKGIKRPSRKSIEQIEDKAFLAWLRTLPCVYCQKPPPSDPAHVRLGGRGGMGMKPLFSAVPLCRTCHDLQHSKSHIVLWGKDDWIDLADGYLKRWKGMK